jgi:hypothetical protein
MNITNKDIRDQFDFFRELISVGKIVISKTIHLEPKKSNAKWLIGQSSVQHETINEEILFAVERSKRDSKYGIKLRCPSLTDEPFFRFDSDGPAHRNDFPEIPLEEQLVTTPHFNSYKEDGKPIAYKSDELKNRTHLPISTLKVLANQGRARPATDTSGKDSEDPLLQMVADGRVSEAVKMLYQEGMTAPNRIAGRLHIAFDAIQTILAEAGLQEQPAPNETDEQAVVVNWTEPHQQTVVLRATAPQSFGNAYQAPGKSASFFLKYIAEQKEKVVGTPKQRRGY